MRTLPEDEDIFGGRDDPDHPDHPDTGSGEEIDRDAAAAVEGGGGGQTHRRRRSVSRGTIWGGMAGFASSLRTVRNDVDVIGGEDDPDHPDTGSGDEIDRDAAAAVEGEGGRQTHRSRRSGGRGSIWGGMTGFASSLLRGNSNDDVEDEDEDEDAENGEEESTASSLDSQQAPRPRLSRIKTSLFENGRQPIMVRLDLSGHACDDCDNSDDGDSSSNDGEQTGGMNISTRGKSPQAHRQSVRSIVSRKSDEDMLSRALSEAGLNAFGVVFVECWVLSSCGTKLKRPPGGHWMDPIFVESLRRPERAASLGEEAPSYPIGASLAGALFKETASLGTQKVHWKQLMSLINDPYVLNGTGRRMERLHEIGVGITSATRFDMQGRQGIVLYMSRTTANYEKLRSAENERYLVCATNLIGAAFAIRIPREARAKIRREEFRAAIAKVRRQLIEKRQCGQLCFTKMTLEIADKSDPSLKQKLTRTIVAQAIISQDELEGLDKTDDKTDARWSGVEHLQESLANNPLIKICTDCLAVGGSAVARTLKTSHRKWSGARQNLPPRASTFEATRAFFGALLVMSIINRINDLFTDNIPEWAFDTGWYPSTLCIIFTLNAGPTCQPRQILLAHVWCVLVGMAMQKIPSHANGFDDLPSGWGLPLYLKQSIAVAAGLAGQARLGITHPPATGLAYAFATRESNGWRTLASLLVADVAVILMAVLLVNLSKEEHYPMFWIGRGDDLHRRSRSGENLHVRKKVRRIFWDRGKRVNMRRSQNNRACSQDEADDTV